MKALVPIICFVLLCGVSGCGGNVSTISGKVTLEGKILDKGDIGFHQAEGVVVSTTRINPDGSYTIGAEAKTLPGNYKVVIIANEVSIAKGPGSVPMPTRITPLAYSSKEQTPLKAELKAGPNEFNFDLKSK
ncbi:MAG: hypothetical protein EBT92_08730 [Planctomycetes bacterium]|nr:hypothetical protein [Planctomycetota bacterium]NBY00774.1 hypothetical protein [Planctomycetota bacterium]